MNSVFIYTRVLPWHTGMGAAARIYTNVRSYTDLGYDTHIVYLARKDLDKLSALEQMGVKTHHHRLPGGQASLMGRLCFHLGLLNENTLGYRYPHRKWLQALVNQLDEQSQGPAIHHFEYLSTGNVIWGLPNITAIYSSLDLEVHRRPIQQTRDLRRKDRLKNRVVEQVEREVVRRADLVLAIADHEAAVMRDEWGVDHVAVLPMSWPDERRIPRQRAWAADGTLRLLHVGKLDALVTHDSLRFLMDEVFEELAPAVLERIELLIVGKVTDAPKAQYILERATQFPQVQILGFQEELESFFGTTDLQVVGATAATGLRTRIIESFVRGLPVISTVEGARGIIGLQHEQNILLADSAGAFATELELLIDNPNRLDAIAEGGYAHYQATYSRAVERDTLKHLLGQHILDAKR